MPAGAGEGLGREGAPASAAVQAASGRGCRGDSRPPHPQPLSPCPGSLPSHLAGEQAQRVHDCQHGVGHAPLGSHVAGAQNGGVPALLAPAHLGLCSMGRRWEGQLADAAINRGLPASPSHCSSAPCLPDPHPTRLSVTWCTHRLPFRTWKRTISPSHSSYSWADASTRSCAHHEGGSKRQGVAGGRRAKGAAGGGEQRPAAELLCRLCQKSSSRACCAFPRK